MSESTPDRTRLYNELYQYSDAGIEFFDLMRHHVEILMDEWLGQGFDMCDVERITNDAVGRVMMKWKMGI